MSSDDYKPFATRGLSADFRVHYRFLAPDEGGRKTSISPGQGYRPEWLYAGDDVQAGIWAIYPEFEDVDGQPIPRGTPALPEGNARMVILNPQLRAEIHRHRIQVGVRGYFMEGPHRVAEAVVIEVVDLHKNPTQS
jgi:hypothetical protein